ncbi:hypothetical protein WG66_000478 [Moniliophthora roreri]|nr:hypothetical protein WG66_000478 [Moniliophthora roreri]
MGVPVYSYDAKNPDSQQPVDESGSIRNQYWCLHRPAYPLHMFCYGISTSIGSSKELASTN